MATATAEMSPDCLTRYNVAIPCDVVISQVYDGRVERAAAPAAVSGKVVEVAREMERSGGGGVSLISRKAVDGE